MPEPICVPPANWLDAKICLAIGRAIRFSFVFGQVERIVEVFGAEQHNPLFDAFGFAAGFEVPAKQAFDGVPTFHSRLTLEVSGRCHSERQITVARRSGPLDRIVRASRTNALKPMRVAQ